jgi:hypothetical protein
MGLRCWEQTGEYLSKVAIVTIFFFILLATNAGNVFAFVAGGVRGVHQLVGVIFNKGGFADWLCRMTEGFLALQTCKAPNYNQKRLKKCTKHYYVQRLCCHSRMTTWRYSTFAWKTRRQKSRLKVALCLTSLPIIINANASSSVNTFPEGVSFDTDSFLIAIDSGSTYCLSDRRSDFEGALIRVD